MRCLAGLMTLVLALPCLARADGPDVLVRATETTDETALASVITRLREANRTPVTSARALLEQAPLERATRADLETLYAVERALLAARAHASELDESRALADVARAQRYSPALIAMPGGRVFLAEVEVALALVAWQQGNRRLAEASLARAISLDPRRRLRAADADPDLVALADALLAASERRPRESLTVRANVAASVFVDDVLVGHTPARVEIRAGTHIVRIVAPLYAPYASLVTLERDVALDVELSPRPGATLVARLERSLDARALEDVVHTLGALDAESRPMTAVFVQDGATVLCSAEGCTRPMQTEAFDPSEASTHSASETIAALASVTGPGESDRGRALRERRHSERDTRRRRIRLLAIGSAIAGAAGITTAALVARPTHQRLRVDVTFE